MFFEWNGLYITNALNTLRCVRLLRVVGDFSDRDRLF